MSFHKLQKLNQEYKDVKEAMKHADNDDNYYALGNSLEVLAANIAQIEENIPSPPESPRPKYDDHGNRLDAKGRRVLLINKPYNRKFAR